MRDLLSVLKVNFKFFSLLLEVFPVRPGLMSPPRTKTSFWNSELGGELSKLLLLERFQAVDLDSGGGLIPFGNLDKEISSSFLFSSGFERDQFGSLWVLAPCLPFFQILDFKLGFSTERVSSAPGLPGEPQGRRKRMRKAFKTKKYFSISNPPFMKNDVPPLLLGQGFVPILGFLEPHHQELQDQEAEFGGTSWRKVFTAVPAKPITSLNLPKSSVPFRLTLDPEVSGQELQLIHRSVRIFAEEVVKDVLKIEKEV